MDQSMTPSLPQQAPGNPGLSPAVQAAMERRGPGPGAMQAGNGALTQQSPGAMTANPPAQPTPPSQMDKSSAPPGSGSSPSQKFQAQNQEDAVVLALIEKMKNNDKLNLEKLKMGSGSKPSVPAFAPAGSPITQQQPLAGAPPGGEMPPMGGGGVPMNEVSDPFKMPRTPSSAGDFLSPSIPSFNMNSGSSIANNQKQGGYPF